MIKRYVQKAFNTVDDDNNYESNDEFIFIDLDKISYIDAPQRTGRYTEFVVVLYVDSLKVDMRFDSLEKARIFAEDLYNDISKTNE